MPVQDSIVTILEERVLRGDFRLTRFPAERELAKEMGASRNTTRLALSRLVDRGVLTRRKNGRIVPNTGDGPLSEVTHVAYLRPANGLMNPRLDRVTRLGADMGVQVRSVEYIDWNDPVVKQTIESFDGTFLEPTAEVVPDAFLKMLQTTSGAVVTVQRDFSEIGIRSLDFAPAGLSSRLLDYLYGLGHREIACLNTQPDDESMAAKMQAWRVWKAARGVEGELFNEPVKSYGDPVVKAYQVVDALLARGTLCATALFCTTSSAGIGAMRAAYDHGLTIGKEISIAGLNDDGHNRFLMPSLTAVLPDDVSPHIRLCLQWMKSGGAATDWPGPLLLRPADAKIFEGESTGHPVNTDFN